MLLYLILQGGEKKLIDYRNEGREGVVRDIWHEVETRVLDRRRKHGVC